MPLTVSLVLEDDKEEIILDYSDEELNDRTGFLQAVLEKHIASNVVVIKLDNNYGYGLNDDTVEPIFKFLRESKTLKELHINGNAIGNLAIKLIVDSILQNPR